jgi:hypothetical protein
MDIYESFPSFLFVYLSLRAPYISHSLYALYIQRYYENPYPNIRGKLPKEVVSSKSSSLPKSDGPINITAHITHNILISFIPCLFICIIFYITMRASHHILSYQFFSVSSFTLISWHSSAYLQ